MNGVVRTALVAKAAALLVVFLVFATYTSVPAGSQDKGLQSAQSIFLDSAKESFAQPAVHRRALKQFRGENQRRIVSLLLALSRPTRTPSRLTCNTTLARENPLLPCADPLCFASYNLVLNDTTGAITCERIPASTDRKPLLKPNAATFFLPYSADPFDLDNDNVLGGAAGIAQANLANTFATEVGSISQSQQADIGYEYATMLTQALGFKGAVQYVLTNEFGWSADGARILADTWESATGGEFSIRQGAYIPGAFIQEQNIAKGGARSNVGLDIQNLLQFAG